MSSTTVESRSQGQSSSPVKWPYGARISVTLCLVLFTITVAIVPGVSTALQFDRHASIGGAWWQFLSGHFVHWNIEHLFWDLTMFAMLGCFCEKRSRQRFVVALLLAGLAIPIALWTWLPDLQTYRGLSGLDTALFTLLTAGLLREHWRGRRWAWVLAIGGLLMGLATKIAFELATGTTLFVDAAAANFQPVPLAHVVGGVIGLAVGLTDRRVS